MKIGVQTWTIRNYLKTPGEIKASFKRIREMGFELVQLSGLGPIDTDELADILKENGISATGDHSSWDNFSDKTTLSKFIEQQKKLGCFQIGIGAKPAIFPDTYEGYTDFIKKVNEICDQAEEAGIGFSYHNHEFEFMKFNGERAIDRLIKECPKMEFTLDVFWVQAGGMNPCDYIDKLKDKIKVLHLKDYRIINRQRQFAEIGQGNLDWPSIFSKCALYNIPYAVIEQDGDYLVDPFESLALSKKYLEDNGYFKA